MNTSLSGHSPSPAVSVSCACARDRHALRASQVVAFILIMSRNAWTLPFADSIEGLDNSTTAPNHAWWGQSAAAIVKGRHRSCFANTAMCRFAPECGDWLDSHLNKARLPNRRLIVQPFLIQGCPASGTTYTADSLKRLGVSAVHEFDPPNRVYDGARGRDGMVNWAARCTSLLNYWPDGGPGPTGGDGDVKVLFRKLIHQVRHPISTIRSELVFFAWQEKLPVCSGTPSPCWFDDSFLRAAIPIEAGRRSWGRETLLRYLQVHSFPLTTFVDPHRAPDGSIINATLLSDPRVMAARHWLSWNTMLESVADWRFLVENTSTMTICRHLGLPEGKCTLQKRGTPPTSNQTNTKAGGSAQSWAARRQRWRDEHWPVSWEALRSADPKLEQAVWEMAQRYGYDREPMASDNHNNADEYSE